VLCGRHLAEGQIVCPYCDRDRGVSADLEAKPVPVGTFGTIRHLVRELFVMERITPGDDEQYQRALEKKIARKLFEFKLGMLIVGVMAGLMLVVQVIWFFK
jgi:hypothetical protein